MFEDGQFSAADLDSPPLLTINAPIGLNFRDKPGDITVGNSLTIEGKGGIPAAPDLPLDSRNIDLDGENSNSTSNLQPIETRRSKIQPAKGIQVTKDGEIILTAYRTNPAGDRIPDIKPNCS